MASTQVEARQVAHSKPSQVGHIILQDPKFAQLMRKNTYADEAAFVPPVYEKEVLIVPLPMYNTSDRSVAL